MKKRNCFVSNSSTSSFIVEQKQYFKSFLNCVCYLVNKSNWGKDYGILENLNIQFSTDKECRRFLKDYINTFDPRNHKIQDYNSKNDRNYDYHITYSDYSQNYLTIKALSINFNILQWVRDNIDNYNIDCINICEDLEEWNSSSLCAAMIRCLLKRNNIIFESCHITNDLNELEDIVIGKKEMVTA